MKRSVQLDDEFFFRLYINSIRRDIAKWKSKKNDLTFKCTLKKHFVKRSFFATNSAIFTCAIHWARNYYFQTSRINDYEHIHNHDFNVKKIQNDYERDRENYALIIRDWCSKNSQITWWSRYCKITRKFKIQRRRQRANVNDRIAIQFSRYEL